MNRGLVLVARESACRRFRLGQSVRFVSCSQDSVDVAIVGGGIVGLAAAQELILRHPNLTFAVIEKEKNVAQHQSGHNSGVIHAGIYYKPGSLMAKLCVEGLHATYAYCDKYNIPYRKCGKIVVATNETEVGRLRDLWERAKKNGVPDIQHLVGENAIKKVEPHCRGLEALWSPHTGIVDWNRVAQYYANNFEGNGGKIFTGFEANEFLNEPDGTPRKIRIKGKEQNQIIDCDFVLTCGGLQSDRLASLTGCSPEPKIVPFRGEFLLLNPKKAHLIKGNIYPVPDPEFPFLGVHFTPRMNGEVWLGPNAVLAFKREGYSWFDFSVRDLSEVLMYPGFYKLASKYLVYGSSEIMRSVFINLSVKHLQKFIPEITGSDIVRGSSGVRAQAMNTKGDLIGDFVFDSVQGSNILHCRNAPSPGATSSIAIGRMLADKMEDQFNWAKKGNAKLF